MPTLLRRLALLGLGTFGSLFSRGVSAQPAPQESTVQGAEPVYRPSPVAFALRLFPPLGYWGVTSQPLPTVGLGGVGVGIISQGGLWIEGSVRHLQGLEGAGADGTLLVGYAVDREPFPGTWDFSAPIHVGYRYAARPNMDTSDSYAIIEKLNLLMAGTRAVWTHHGRLKSFELSLGALAGFTESRTEPENLYYSDGPTHSWFEVMVTLGVVFGGVHPVYAVP